MIGFENMYCPDCGAKTKEGQQYCRRCGAGLREGLEKRSGRDPRALGFLAVMVMLVGLLVSMVGKYAGVGPVILLGGLIVVLSAIAAVGGTYYYGIHKRRPRRRNATRNEVPEAEITVPADTTNKLPPIPAADHFPSVTEHTTTRLGTRVENDR
jgi:hypothetical protein